MQFAPFLYLLVVAGEEDFGNFEFFGFFGGRLPAPTGSGKFILHYLRPSVGWIATLVFF